MWVAVSHFCSAFLCSKGNVSKISTKFYISFFMLSGIPAAVPDVRACMTLQLLIRLSGNTEVNQLIVCLFNIGTSAAYLHMVIPDYFYLRHTYQFTKLILFVSQKHILILLLHLMKKIWRFLGKISFVLTIHLIPIVELSVSTAKAIYHQEF